MKHCSAEKLRSSVQLTSLVWRSTVQHIAMAKSSVSTFQLTFLETQLQMRFTDPLSEISHCAMPKNCIGFDQQLN
jgi:hypothetical protein